MESDEGSSNHTVGAMALSHTALYCRGFSFRNVLSSLVFQKEKNITGQLTSTFKLRKEEEKGKLKIG